MNRVKLKPYLERPEGDGTNDTAIAREAWSKHLQRDNSVITDHIGSLMRSELTCPDCNKVLTYLILVLLYKFILYYTAVYYLHICIFRMLHMYILLYMRLYINAFIGVSVFRLSTYPTSSHPTTRSTYLITHTILIHTTT